MNPSQRSVLFPAAMCVLAVAFKFAASSAEAALLAGWDFQGTTGPGAPIGTVISQPPSTPRDYTANAGIFQSFSHMYLDGTNGSSSFTVIPPLNPLDTPNTDTELGALNGISANAEGTNFNTSNSIGSMALFSRPSFGGINGKSAVFKLSMDGYQDLDFSFAVQRPNNTNGGGYGVSIFDFSYSTDGTNFLPWGSIDTGMGTQISNLAFTLNPILQSVNDADSVYIMMTMSGATGFNSTRLDNIQFNATAIPEPTSIAILLSGIGFLGASRRRVRIA